MLYICCNKICQKFYAIKCMLCYVIYILCRKQNMTQRSQMNTCMPRTPPECIPLSSTYMETQFALKKDARQIKQYYQKEVIFKLYGIALSSKSNQNEILQKEYQRESPKTIMAYPFGFSVTTHFPCVEDVCSFQELMLFNKCQDIYTIVA